MKDIIPIHKHPTNKETKVKRETKTAPGRALVNLTKPLLTLSVISLVIYCITFIPDYLTQPIKPQLINISGNNVLTTEALLNTLPIYKNTRWIDIDSFELSNMLAKHPWVEKAYIHRRPNLGIDIKITEISPVAFLKSKDKLFLLSRDLRLLTVEYIRTGWDLPVIVNNIKLDAKPGDYLLKSALQKAFELIALLESSEILPLNTISEINITDPLNIVLVVMPHAIRIKMGFSEFQEKLLNLNDTLVHLEQEAPNIRYIDLRYKRAVVFRRKA